MRAKIAALLVGLVLGSSATAMAAATYWREVGNTYVCQGVDAYVLCRTRGSKPRYEVAVNNKLVSVYFGGHIVFSCEHRWYPMRCNDFR